MQNCFQPNHPTPIMKITTYTQNVQGLNEALKVDVVRHYYRPLLAGIDILCFQEHRLRDAKSKNLKLLF